MNSTSNRPRRTSAPTKNQPDLFDAGTEEARQPLDQEPRRPYPERRRPQGRARKGQQGRQRDGRPPRNEGGAPIADIVTIRPEWVDELARYGRRLPLYDGRRKSNMIRVAVCNSIYRSKPQDMSLELATLWHHMGSVGSAYRDIKPPYPGVTEQHDAWQYVQWLLQCMTKTANDPVASQRQKGRTNRFLMQALNEWDQALQAHFQQHPEHLLTPDERAGMGVWPDAHALRDLPIFEAPPKGAPAPRREVKAPGETEPTEDPVAQINTPALSKQEVAPLSRNDLSSSERLGTKLLQKARKILPFIR